jgi:hypothetical protein
MNARFRITAGLALAAACAVAGAWRPAGATAADEPPPGDSAAPPADDATGPPGAGDPEIAPQVQSPYHLRVYRIKPKKLWKGLLEQLEAAGFPPEEVDPESMTVRTSFTDFSQDDYAEQVADPPPYLSPRFPILQMVKVREGKMSMEAIVSKAERGSELKLRTRILVQGIDRRKGIRVLTDRRSSGVIEAEFLLRLEQALGLERIVVED